MASDAEEWLDLTPLESADGPLRVETVTGWLGTGAYLETFALIIGGAGRELVIMTTDEFDLRCASRREARDRAEVVAAAMNMELIERML